MTRISAVNVSVIMPCYNAAEHLVHTLSSVLDQTDTALELIAVDDGSSDDTLPMLRAWEEKDARLRVLTQVNRGPGPARNHGLAEARGTFIAFLDADDYWAPEFLAEMCQALSNTTAGLAYCGWQNVGLPGGRGKPFIPPDYSSGDKVETFLGGCRWPIHAALTRREVIEAVGGFDERWTSCMDYDLWLRIATAYDIVLVPKVLAFYRHHEGIQITKNRARGAINHWRIQRRFLNNHPEVARRLGHKRVQELTRGELIRRGFDSYWERDLTAAHAIFRKAMGAGIGNLSEWKYLLPALLPLPLYRRLITFVDRKRTLNHG